MQKIQHISESPSLSEMFFPPTFQLPILVTSTQNMLLDNQLILSSILVLTLPSTFLLCTLGQLTLFMNRIILQTSFLLTLSTASRFSACLLPILCPTFASVPLYQANLASTISGQNLARLLEAIQEGQFNSHSQVPTNMPTRRYTMFLTPRNYLQGGHQQGNVCDNEIYHI